MGPYRRGDALIRAPIRALEGDPLRVLYRKESREESVEEWAVLLLRSRKGSVEEWVVRLLRSAVVRGGRMIAMMRNHSK